MLTDYRFAVPVVVLFLITAAGLTLFEETMVQAIVMLCLSPFMFGWMVYSILMHSDLEHPLVEFNAPDFSRARHYINTLTHSLKSHHFYKTGIN